MTRRTKQERLTCSLLSTVSHRNGRTPRVTMLLVALFLPHIVLSTEFNCAAPQTHGSFTRMTDCTLVTTAPHGLGIQVSDIMSLTGRNDLTTITAATNQRHFYITTQTLTLKWLILTGGNVIGHAGGSIQVDGGGHLLVYSSLLTKNIAGYRGGAIYSDNGANIELYDTNVTHNSVTLGIHGGGGIWMQDETSSLLVSNCMIAYNNITGVSTFSLSAHLSFLFFIDLLH